ncbi:MAG TPA: DUF2188 domain-containing protein [Clostridia bacterium]|nr:DUF2188 domain-containing protein [Clostridia bacterium]
MRIHVIFKIDKWLVTASDCRKIADYTTKAAAVKKGIAVAKEEKARLYVHKQDGTVEKVTEYGEKADE